MAEEILGVLGEDPSLRVIGRTSSWRFKDRAVAPQAARRALGVDHLLEGSVRAEGERVRVSARLVRTSDGAQLWSQAYDRDLRNIFALQDEIGADVARELSGALRATRSPVRRPVAPAVYDRYLAARALMRGRDLEGLTEALRLDPSYAPAWAGLARVTHLLSADFLAVGSNPVGSAEREARGYAERALSLDPHLAEAHAVLGEILYPMGAAEAPLERAVALDPNLSQSWYFLGGINNRQGRTAAGARYIRRAIDIEPLWTPPYISLAQQYAHEGRLRELEALKTEFASAYGDPRVVHAMNANAALILDDSSRAVVQARAAERAGLGGPQNAVVLAQALLQLDLRREALAAAPEREAMLKLFIQNDEAGVTREARRRGSDIWLNSADSFLGLRALVGAGRMREAAALYDARYRSPDEFDRQEMSRVPSLSPNLILAFRATGRGAEAEVLERLARDRLRRYSPNRQDREASQAQIEAVDGRAEAALDHLERAYELGWRPMTRFADYPAFRPLLHHPRLKALEARMEADRRRELAELARETAPEARP